MEWYLHLDKDFIKGQTLSRKKSCLVNGQWRLHANNVGFYMRGYCNQNYFSLVFRKLSVSLFELISGWKKNFVESRAHTGLLTQMETEQTLCKCLKQNAALPPLPQFASTELHLCFHCRRWSFLQCHSPSGWQRMDLIVLLAPWTALACHVSPCIERSGEWHKKVWADDDNLELNEAGLRLEDHQFRETPSSSSRCYSGGHLTEAAEVRSSS